MTKYKDIINEKIVSVRELQREYRKIVDYIKKTKKPVYICKYNKLEVVMLDIATLDNIVRLNKWKRQYSNKTRRIGG